jgi:2-C-methyl-D-erythritol 4-phosphate cytidylyltransferase
VIGPQARLWAVLAAAGSGVRFGAGEPKQYRVIQGRPIIGWSLAPFLARADLAGILVVVAAGDEHWSRCRPDDPRVETVTGGRTRAASVSNALAGLAERAEALDWVLVHDAARPCLTDTDLDHLIRRLADEPVGGLLAAPIADTLKQEAGGRVAATVERSRLWRALTPQMFRYGLLCDALDANPDVTDESAAIERAGHRPLLVPGRGDNIKVTTREDYVLADAVLAARS